MSVFKEIDVERRRRDLNLCGPVGKPVKSGLSVAVLGAPKTNPSAFFDDYCGEHTTPGKINHIDKTEAHSTARDIETNASGTVIDCPMVDLDDVRFRLRVSKPEAHMVPIEG